MKKRILILLLLTVSYGFSQSVNDYKSVIIPLKFDFTKSENQYRLATLSKFNLNKALFEAYYSNETIGEEFNNRCNLLYFDVVKEKSFLTTKLHVVFKDCNDKIIFQSETGTSKEKDFQLAYTEALNKAFVSVSALKYKYNGIEASSKQQTITATAIPISIPAKSNNDIIIVDKISSNLFYAQPITNGFQLVDSSPKVVMKVFKTSNVNCYIAVKGNTQGVLIAKDNQWFFEYYQNDSLVSEKIDVKF
jgi:Lhr-like helicase